MAAKNLSQKKPDVLNFLRTDSEDEGRDTHVTSPHQGHP